MQANFITSKIKIMITLKNLSKTVRGNKLLFENVNITFNPGQRYALTGPNGCGKSTLLKILMGMDDATGGGIVRPKKIGYLRQNIEDFHDYSLLDTTIMGNQDLWSAFEERDRIYEKEEITDQDGLDFAEIEEIIADENGYEADSEAASLLSGMLIDEELHDKKMSDLPTDVQFKVLLCQALFGTPQALILDEPTNHLDMNSIVWLEKFLKTYPGTVIFTSHDKNFLNNLSTMTADIDYDTIIMYPGNYDNMLMMKTTLRRKAEKENASKQKKIDQLNEFVAKFSAGTRASQVQSRKKKLVVYRYKI